MRFSPIFVFLNVVVLGAFVNAMAPEAPLSQEARALSVGYANDIEARGHHSINIKVQLRELFDEEDLYERDYFDDAAEEFVARFGDSETVQKREPEPFFVDGLQSELEERDYEEWLDNLSARYYDELELEERFDLGMDGVEDIDARELDAVDIDTREPMRHFRCGTVILHPPSSD